MKKKRKEKKRKKKPKEKKIQGDYKEEKLFMGGFKCETNDFVTLVKPLGGMAAWVITVRQRAGN